MLQEEYVWTLENSKEDYFKDKPCLYRHVGEATIYWLEASFLEICQHKKYSYVYATYDLSKKYPFRQNRWEYIKVMLVMIFLAVQ